MTGLPARPDGDRSMIETKAATSMKNRRIFVCALIAWIVVCTVSVRAGPWQPKLRAPRPEF